MEQEYAEFQAQNANCAETGFKFQAAVHKLYSAHKVCQLEYVLKAILTTVKSTCLFIV